MSFSAESSGSFDNLEKFLKQVTQSNTFAFLDALGKRGVAALAAATPVDKGETAAAWGYEIVKDRGSHSIIWTNSHVVNGTPVAVLIQHDHGTRNGGFSKGVDYINPALEPIFKDGYKDLGKAMGSL